MRKEILGIWFIIFPALTAIMNACLVKPVEAEPLFNHLYQPTRAEQEGDEEDELELDLDYLKGYLSDTRDIITSPSRWGSLEWTEATLMVGITLGLYTYDQDIQDWVRKNRNDTSDTIAKLAEPFGDGMYILPSIGLFYLYGHFSMEKKTRRIALLGLESFIISGLFVRLIKVTGHRHRPSSGDPYNTWDGPAFSNSNVSFPSGHSSSAFAMAAVIASEYKYNVFIPPLVYGIGALSALSRVNDNAHWASDVFFGSAIGYFTAKAIVGLHGDTEDRRTFIFPVMSDKHVALLILYGF